MHCKLPERRECVSGLLLECVPNLVAQLEIASEISIRSNRCCIKNGSSVLEIVLCRSDMYGTIPSIIVSKLALGGQD